MAIVKVVIFLYVILCNSIKILPHKQKSHPPTKTILPMIGNPPKVLRLEDYIAQRKKDDQVNEFTLSARAKNMESCIKYVSEYFENYLNFTSREIITTLQTERVDKYRKRLRRYSQEVREWLIKMYICYQKQLDRSISNALREDSFFWLYSSEKEFRQVSYDCYALLIEKHPYLSGQTEMLYLFAKDYRQIMQTQRAWMLKIPFISESITSWAEDTWVNHKVSIVAFSRSWVTHFYRNEDLWPSTHKKKSYEFFWKEYDYDFKQKTNLFNIDSLYEKMPKNSFTEGRKKDFEIMMMYFWLNEIWGKDEPFWENYLKDAS